MRYDRIRAGSIPAPQGNATSNELRFAKSEQPRPVGNVSIAVTDRTKNADGVWVDGKTSFYEVTVWGAAAEHFAASVSKGDRILVAGELAVEEYPDNEGAPKIRRRITAEHVGISTRFGTVTAQRQ